VNEEALPHWGLSRQIKNFNNEKPFSSFTINVQSDYQFIDRKILIVCNYKLNSAVQRTSHAARHSVHTPQPETSSATTLPNL